jgi:hypothetical protein
MSNVELWTTKVKGAAEEKIRRSYNAICFYNDTVAIASWGSRVTSVHTPNWKSALIGSSALANTSLRSLGQEKRDVSRISFTKSDRPFGQKAIASYCRQLPILVEEDATSDTSRGRCHFRY